MKKFTLKFLVTLSLAVLLLITPMLAACDRGDPRASIKGIDKEIPINTNYTAPSTATKVTLNTAIMFDNNARMWYTAGSFKPYTESTATSYSPWFSDTVYTVGDLKPVWAQLGTKMNVEYVEKAPAAATNVSSNFDNLQTAGFTDVDVLVGPAVKINEEGISNGTFLDLSQHMDQMPNFAKFLNDNTIVRKNIRSGEGSIYYAPYFDGYDDLERMFIMRADWVEKLLDSDTATYDTAKTLGTTHYTQFLPDNLNTNVTVANSAGTATQTINKKYGAAGNVIKTQNALATKNGATLVQALKDHIDAVYGKPGTTGAKFAKRSDLFVGQDAAYDADELVALLRCVKTNPNLLTGSASTDIVPFYPRESSSDRLMDMLRLGEIWGTRGLDARSNFMYIDTEGKLRDTRLDMSTLDTVERLNQLYKEGLILQNPDVHTGTSRTNHRQILNNANRGFMTYDYNQTTTVFNSLGDGATPTIAGYNLTPVLPPVTNWDNDWNKMYQFTDSWRSVKTEGWAILDSVKSDATKLARLLYIFDYMFTEEGNTLMSFGPTEYLAKKADGSIDTVSYKGKQVPKLHDNTLAELNNREIGNKSATNYYRRFLGGTFPIGYVKDQGMEYQTVHEKGQVGLNRILKAVELGTVKYTKPSDANLENKAFLMTPTTFAFTKQDQDWLTAETATLNQYFNPTNGSNPSTVVIYNDYIMFGFGGTKAGETLLSKQALLDQITTTWKGAATLEIYRDAYARVTNAAE